MKRTSAKTKSSRQKTAVQDRGLYTFRGFPGRGAGNGRVFWQRIPSSPRTIKIRADQTLAELQCGDFQGLLGETSSIMYEFQVGGKGPQDPKAHCYVLPMAMKDHSAGPNRWEM